MSSANPAVMREQLRSAQWNYDDARYMGVSEIISSHRALHDSFGVQGFEAVLDIEQEYSKLLRGLGIEHRYDDALSKAAGTYIESPREPTLIEVKYYLQEIGLDAGAVDLVRDVGGGSVFINVKSKLLAGLESSIVKAMNRYMPPGLQLKHVTRGMKEGFVEKLPAYGLKLESTHFDTGVQVTLWDSVTARLRASAASASSVFKATMDPIVPFKMLIQKAIEADSEEVDGGPVTVTGVVLEPEIVDGTVSKDSTTGEICEGDIYSVEEIRKGMCWWMENASASFSYLHMEKGGYPLTGTEVVLHECWQTRVDQTIGTQSIKAGTWMMTTKVRDLKLCKDIREGRINSWSVGMRAMGGIERVQEAAQ
uniref:Putative peptidase n=1 Tax=viral metagenome TaxID=1070528 RepID=A0A6M3XVC7_9ZZZZ